MKVFTSISDPAVEKLLQSASVGVIPTDTVYGLVASAHNQVAVERLYTLKHREHKPGTIMAANADQLVELGIKRRYLKAVEDFWPGAISIIVPVGPELEYLDQGLRGLAVRIPDDKPLQKLLQKTGPLLSTSANEPNSPTATTIRMAQEYFKQTVDFYVEGGDLSEHLPSTIIKIVDDAIEIIRPGAVTIDENGRQA